MLTALAVLRAALTGLYDESLLLLRANLLWLLVNLPLLILGAVAVAPWWVPSAPGATIDAAPLLLLLVLFHLLPSPGQMGMSGLALVIARRDSPALAVFWETLRGRGRQCAQITLVGWGGFLVLAGNAAFYLAVLEGPWRLAAAIWGYAVLFWLALHLYLLPLLHHVREPRLLDLYRRAAALALAQPLFTVTLLAFAAIMAVLGIALPPLYVLGTGAFVSLLQAYAFRDLCRRYGDADEADGDGAPWDLTA